MAGKTKEMSQIKQLLFLKKEGASNRKAADIVGINKETANNYVKKALADELGIDGLLKLDDPVLEHRLKGGSPAYTDKRFEAFKELLPYLQDEMTRKHVTLKLLWEEYVQEHPDDHYSLTQFRFHYNQNTEAKKESPSTILADMRTGGEKLFLDFAGDTMGYIDIETGEIVQCQAFVATLPASDYGYLLFVPSQRTEDFVYAITQCLKHLGGVPKMLVPDNLKAAVIKTDRYEPSLNRVLEDMGNHYGTIVLPFTPDAETLKGYTFYELTDVETNALTFDEVSSPVAGKPYIVTSDGTATKMGAEAESTVVIEPAATEADGWTMTGTYESVVFTDADELASLYCISGNQFKQATSKLTMNPFRAYFVGDGSVNSITLRGDDGTTNIISLNSQSSILNSPLYDLQGRRVEHAEQGIYIQNGKKVLVK